MNESLMYYDRCAPQDTRSGTFFVWRETVAAPRAANARSDAALQELLDYQPILVVVDGGLTIVSDGAVHQTPTEAPDSPRAT